MPVTTPPGQPLDRDVLDERIRASLASYRSLRSLLDDWWVRSKQVPEEIKFRKSMYYYDLACRIREEVEETWRDVKAAGVADPAYTEMQEAVVALWGITVYSPAQALEDAKKPRGRTYTMEEVRRELAARRR